MISTQTMWRIDEKIIILENVEPILMKHGFGLQNKVASNYTMSYKFLKFIDEWSYCVGFKNHFDYTRIITLTK